MDIVILFYRTRMNMNTEKKMFLQAAHGNSVAFTSNGANTFKCFKSAKFCIKTKSKIRRFYKYNTIIPGKVVYFLANDDSSVDILNQSMNGEGTYMFLAVCHIIGYIEEAPWIIGFIMQKKDDFYTKTRKVSVVKLTSTKRTASTIHTCYQHCKVISCLLYTSPSPRDA